MSPARLAAVLALVGAAVVAVVLLRGGDDGYTVRAELRNAGGLREGFKVRVDGVPVGKVKKVELSRNDVAIADISIVDSAAPLGRDARATVRAVNILGEKYLDIERGNARDPAPSGVVIPVSRTGVAIELDDVIDTLDLPTRAALNVVLDEGGRGLAGRGSDLARTVAALPSSLDRAGDLLDELGTGNRALGRLVDESDRVVAGVARERADLGRLIAGAATTLDALGGRRRQLGATVRAAPPALASLRSALAALQRAAIPLQPAARGLRATAPALTATLRRLPSTAEAARPALRAATSVAPALDRLGARGTPVARRLRPLARQLAVFSSDVDPATRAFDDGFADILGVMEAWARATGPRDTTGHIFRLAVGGGADLIEALARGAAPPAKRRADRAPSTGSPTPRPGATLPQLQRPQLRLPQVRVPKVRLPGIPDVAARIPQVQLPAVGGDDVNRLLDYLLSP
jgi:phospholipid/cholesterol/gamma-HCH transport system substrate-binding protein